MDGGEGTAAAAAAVRAAAAAAAVAAAAAAAAAIAIAGVGVAEQEHSLSQPERRVTCVLRVSIRYPVFDFVGYHVSRLYAARLCCRVRVARIRIGPCAKSTRRVSSKVKNS